MSIKDVKARVANSDIAIAAVLSLTWLTGRMIVLKGHYQHIAIL